MYSRTQLLLRTESEWNFPFTDNKELVTKKESHSCYVYLLKCQLLPHCLLKLLLLCVLLVFLYHCTSVCTYITTKYLIKFTMERSPYCEHNIHNLHMWVQIPRDSLVICEPPPQSPFHCPPYYCNAVDERRSRVFCHPAAVQERKG
jgi:hypothetical protein